MLVVVGLGMLAWLERQPLLRGAADLWIISDAVTHADAAVVLGGGLDDRPFAAAELYHKGLVNKVLVSQVAEDRAATIGAGQGHTESNRQVLLKLGVPTTAIETFGNANQNTWEEAVALKSWADRNVVSVLIIPTEVFSARRVRWVFYREFTGANVRIKVPSFDPPIGYTSAEWWKTERGVITFRNEVLKYFYYRLKY
jgi:hypothetical protein